jgi:hypothetical protein
MAGSTSALLDCLGELREKEMNPEASLHNPGREKVVVLGKTFYGGSSLGLKSVGQNLRNKLS